MASTGPSTPPPRCLRRSTAASRTLALVALDIGWFQYFQDERDLRDAILGRTGLDEATLVINMSHTHAGANVNSQLTEKPGAELIKPYLEHLTEQITAAILAARGVAGARLGHVRLWPLLDGGEPRPVGCPGWPLRLRL